MALLFLLGLMLSTILESLNSGVIVDGDVLPSFHMISATTFSFLFCLSLEVSLAKKKQMKNKDAIHKGHILNCLITKLLL